MKIGVDSNIIVAGLHANHPLHAIAADWLIRDISLNELIVAHHTVLESYAVLTRLPGQFKISSTEAKQLLETTIRPNMQIADFSADTIWDCLDFMVIQTSVGGNSYDCFIFRILENAGVETIATFNTSHFKRFTSTINIIDPSKPQ